MGKQVMFDVEALDRMNEEFLAYPPQAKRQVNKGQGMRRLRPGIEALQGKGYTLAQIAEELSKRGVPVTVAALKSYLTHDNGSGTMGGKGRRGLARRKRASAASSAAGEASLQRSGAGSDGAVELIEVGVNHPMPAVGKDRR